MVTYYVTEWSGNITCLLILEIDQVQINIAYENEINKFTRLHHGRPLHITTLLKLTLNPSLCYESIIDVMMEVETI